MIAHVRNDSTAALVATIVALAALDLVGSMLAKEWTINRHLWMFVLGAISFVALFATYARALRYAELSTVTFGWIVVLQVGVLIVERVRHDVQLPTGKWIAIAGILVLQAYLVLASNETSAGAGLVVDRPAETRSR
jgi:peptidoglycan/LPS O-acetylase OafA/YrhL